MRTLLSALTLAGLILAPVYAQNHAPTVNAGPDTTIRLGITFNFSFVQANDTDGDPLTYAWSKISGAAGGDSIIRPASLGTRTTFSMTGEYIYCIVVSDGSLTAADTIKVTVTDSLMPLILKPVAGEKILIGSTYRITWQLNQPSLAVNIYLLANNGLDLVLLNPGRVTGGSYDWSVTQSASDSCRIQITPYGEEAHILATSEVFAMVDRIDSSSVKGAGHGSGASLVRPTGHRLLPIDRKGPMAWAGTCCDLSGRSIAPLARRTPRIGVK